MIKFDRSAFKRGIDDIMKLRLLRGKPWLWALAMSIFVLAFFALSAAVGTFASMF